MQVHVARFILGAVVVSGLLFSQGLFAQEAQEKSAPSTRTVQFRDPRTGRTITRVVPVGDPNDVPASGPSYRTVQTRDPRTGRTITQQVPANDEALIRLRVQRYRERYEISDEQWQQIEPVLTAVMELQAALQPSPGARFRIAVPDNELSRTPEDAANPTAELKIAYESLTEAARHPEATDEEIAGKMRVYTQKRQQAETELQAAKLQLTELLTTRQQAQLMLEGVL
jgi:hypothetical protein